MYQDASILKKKSYPDCTAVIRVIEWVRWSNEIAYLHC